MLFFRSLWISLIVRYDVHWDDLRPSHTERVNALQMKKIGEAGALEIVLHGFINNSVFHSAAQL
jgi:hypothetical protein